MTNVNCGLTAKIPGSAPSPMLILKNGTPLLFSVIFSTNCITDVYICLCVLGFVGLFTNWIQNMCYFMFFYVSNIKCKYISRDPHPPNWT